MKKVYIEVDPTLYTVGKNTFMDEMLTMIKAKNIVKEEGWPQLNQEAIIAGQSRCHYYNIWFSCREYG